MPTLSRLTRGRPNRSRTCRAGCGVPETNAHVSQACWRTNGARIRRHDQVVSDLTKSLVKLGYSVTNEPLIPTDVGFRKPDIIAVKDGRIYVIDPTICGESINPDYVHSMKVSKYETNLDIGRYLVKKHGDLPIEYGSLTMTYRGVMSSISETFLRSLRVTKGTLKSITAKVMEGSVKCFRWFAMSCEVKPRNLRVKGRHGRK